MTQQHRRIIFSLLSAVLLSAQMACASVFTDHDATATAEQNNFNSTLTALAPTVTPTPTSTPTATPTPTPGPEAGIFDVVLQIDDLPDGFDELSAADMAQVNAQLEDLPYEHSTIFAFQGRTSVEILYGMVFYFDTVSDRNEFDLSLSFLTSVLAETMGSLMTANEEGSADLLEVDELGDIASGHTILAENGTQDIRISTIAFRRGRVGVILFYIHMEPGNLLDDPLSAAAIMDQRIIEAFP